VRTEAPPETSAVEIIEIIDDDEDILRGHRVEKPHNLPILGSRWIGPALAVVLLAVAGYVVVSSSIESHPSTPPDPALIRPQYYVADLPRGFSMYLAEARGEPGVDSAEFADSGQAELWATPDATATTGSWFVVSHGDQHATGRNSYRLIVDGMEVVFEHDPGSGQTRLSFTKDGNPMAITSFGWIDRQLVRLVRSVNIDNSEIRFTDGFFTSDHQRILQADPATAVFGLPAARVGYATGLPAELAENFTITVSGDDVQDLARVRSFALTKPRQFNVGTLPGIVGQWAADPSITVAQWHDGDRLISMQGNFDAERLEAFAQSVHASPAAPVKSQLEVGAPPAVAALRAEPDTVVSGMLSDGWAWTIQVSRRSPQDTGQGYLWWIAQPGDTTTPSETRPSAAGDTPMIDTFVENGRTYVLARIPRSMDGAELHVAPTGLDSIVTRLYDVDPALPDEFAAAVFTQPVPFTARIIAANGMTVAFWPTFGQPAS
jgi:hypothetical protein